MHRELRLTLLVEYVPRDEAAPSPIVREQALCPDVFAVVHELDDPHLAYGRFRAAIAEAFLMGTRDLDRQLTAG